MPKQGEHLWHGRYGHKTSNLADRAARRGLLTDVKAKMNETTTTNPSKICVERKNIE
jgi:hypothetical protein